MMNFVFLLQLKTYLKKECFLAMMMSKVFTVHQAVTFC